MKLILASQSPRRVELLGRITTDFVAIPAQGEEQVSPGTPPRETAGLLALQKAQEVAAEHPGALVIGSDTVVDFNGHRLGKPRDRQDARQMLQCLSGASHWVHTGCALVQGERVERFVSSTQVTFYPLTPEEIDAYLDTGEPFDKAGAYGIQGQGALLVKEIQGDYYTVVGFPLAQVARILRQWGKISKEKNSKI